MCDLMVPADTPPGNTLTHANLADAGVHACVWHLESLLMKPGLEALLQFDTLTSYTGWQGLTAVNGVGLSFKASGSCRVRSVFDGSSQTFTAERIEVLLKTLAPNVLVLPQGFSLSLNAPSTRIYSDTGEHAGIFARVQTVSEAEAKARQFSGQPMYLASNAPFPVLMEMAAIGIEWLESDTPAEDAHAGIVYTTEGAINLAAPEYAMDYEVVDEACTCATCSTPFSRAALHHLYTHTPLLAKRLLVTHNLAFAVRQMRTPGRVLIP